MVILIFSDQARVALRPDSGLLIRRYKVDPNGAETELQLESFAGDCTTRFLAAQPGKQPERYRLNTPIAAIGVRGNRLPGQVRRRRRGLCTKGAIVVAPLGGAGTPGEIPAANIGAGFGVQYSRADRSKNLERQNVGQNDVERLFGMRIAASVSTDRTAAGNTAGNAAQLTRRTGLGANGCGQSCPGPRQGRYRRCRSTASLAGGVVQASVMMVPNTPDLPSPPLVVPPVTSPEVLPPVTPPVVVQLPTQLVWGKFSNPQKLPFTLPVAYADVKDGRHTTVGELGQYALWRDGVNGPLDKSLRGQAQLVALAAGEAFYQAGGQNARGQSHRSPAAGGF